MAPQPPRKSSFEDIDDNLRRVYDEVVNEGVPERFAALLEKLRTGDQPPGQDGIEEERGE